MLNLKNHKMRAFLLTKLQYQLRTHSIALNSLITIKTQLIIMERKKKKDALTALNKKTSCFKHSKFWKWKVNVEKQWHIKASPHGLPQKNFYHSHICMDFTFSDNAHLQMTLYMVKMTGVGNGKNCYNLYAVKWTGGRLRPSFCLAYWHSNVINLGNLHACHLDPGVRQS